MAAQCQGWYTGLWVSTRSGATMIVLTSTAERDVSATATLAPGWWRGSGSPEYRPPADSPEYRTPATTWWPVQHNSECPVFPSLLGGLVLPPPGPGRCLATR